MLCARRELARLDCIEVPQQLAPLHTDKYSSSKPLSAAARASFRFEFECLGQNRAEARQELLAGPLLGVDAGTSSTQLHQSPSRLGIAVYKPMASEP